jgi:hypothetical protein
MMLRGCPSSDPLSELPGGISSEISQSHRLIRKYAAATTRRAARTANIASTKNATVAYFIIYETACTL